ncbi:MAG: NADP oxidoreductase, partial [Candidatus Cloacimonetes bacterium]|nr:NADP oxidoreductase [Candidatus Cloacimonadota bacterium]
LRGNGVAEDVDQMLSWENVMISNRCGLGQTAANPILSTIKNFRELYEDKLNKDTDFVSEFDLEVAVQESCKTANRVPNLGGE